MANFCSYRKQNRAPAFRPTGFGPMLFVQSCFVESYQVRLGLDEKLWTKTRWTKRCWTKSRSTKQNFQIGIRSSFLSDTRFESIALFLQPPLSTPYHIRSKLKKTTIGRTTVRETAVSRHHGVQLGAPKTLSEHQSIMVSIGLWGCHIMPRDTRQLV